MAAPAAVEDGADPSGRAYLARRAVGTVYALAIATYFAFEGIGHSVLALTLLAVGGLAISCIGRGWRRLLQIGIDWAPFTACLISYDSTRGLADSLGIAVHETDIVRWERWTFGGTEPTVWLQQHLYNPTHVYWYDALLTLVYTSHFLLTPVLAAILWLRDRTRWLRYIARIVALWVAGLATYTLFPEAPPWMAARDGLTAPVERLSARGWIWLHAGNVQDLLAKAQSGGSNPVAAMPSLHFAFAVLAALVIGQGLRTRWRWLLSLYPAAMGFALVYLGEHWVLDLAAGLVYVLAVHWLVGRAEEWWRVRKGLTLPDSVPMESGEPVPTR